MSEKLTKREKEAMYRYDSNDNDYGVSNHIPSKYKCNRCRDTGHYDSRGCDCDEPNIIKCDCKIERKK